MQNKSSKGFILIEILIASLMTSMIVLGVVGLLLPFKNQMLKQNAWLSLQQTADMATMIFISRLLGAEVVHGTKESIEIKEGQHNVQFLINKTNRKYANGDNIYSLYSREGLQKSEEWIVGMKQMNLAYDIVNEQSKVIVRSERFTKTEKSHVVGIEINLQLTAEQGLTEPWRLYVALKPKR